MTESNSITHDPLYYFTAAFFALLTTALPALLGQPRFLPIIQTLTLTTFVAVALYRRHLTGALHVMTLWLPIQFVLLTGLTRFFDTQVEAAFTNGFAYRGAITSWFFDGAPLPSGLVSEPISTLVELVGIVIGSIATAGLWGNWLLVRLINEAAFGTGILLRSLANPSQALFVIPYWTLLRSLGYAGIIILAASPFLTRNWSPSFYWQNHRNLILISCALIVAGLITELFLPGIIVRPPLN